MDEKSGELRECPFCGGTNIQLSNGETFRWRYVGCAECGAQIEFRSDNRFEPTDETWSDAAEAWNRRSLPAVGMSEGKIGQQVASVCYEMANDGKCAPVVWFVSPSSLPDGTPLYAHQAQRNRGEAGEGWINVESHHRPEEGLTVLVFTKWSLCQWTAYWRNGHWYHALGPHIERYLIKDVTHWKPLAAAPAAGEKEEG